MPLGVGRVTDRAAEGQQRAAVRVRKDPNTLCSIVLVIAGLQTSELRFLTILYRPQWYEVPWQRSRCRCRTEGRSLTASCPSE
jgi:hypothetical protein